jgi:hypothetical protein
MELVLRPLEHREVSDEREAAALALPWKGQPYGLLLCLADDGGKATCITEDVLLHRLLVTAHGLNADTVIPPEVYPLVCDGWPGELDWQLPSAEGALSVDTTEEGGITLKMTAGTYGTLERSARERGVTVHDEIRRVLDEHYERLQAEAEINAATLTYALSGDDGLIRTTPRGGEA